MTDKQAKSNRNILLTIATEPRLAYLLYVGVISIIISLFVDTLVELIHDHLAGTPSNMLFWLRVVGYFVKIFASLMRDIGFASLIALVLGILVERVARQEQQSLIDGALKAIKENVIEAAYSINTPQSIVRLALSSVFAAPIIRENFRISYTISPYPGKANLVLLKIEADSTVKNVSGRTVEYDVRLYIPKRIEPDLKDASKLVGGAIGSDHMTAEVIEQGRSSTEDSDYESKFSWPRNIEAGESLRVVFGIHLVKERSDNEIWTCLIPCERLEVSAISECDDLEWNVDPLFCGELIPQDGEMVGPYGRLARPMRFDSTAPLLPHHGLVLWWRPGAPPSAPLEMSSGEASKN